MMVLRAVFLSALLSTTVAYTHWMVTEDGLQPKDESFFALKRPHDLVAFIHQGQEGDRLETMRRKLLKRKQVIDANRPSYSDDKLITEEDFVKSDPACRVSGKILSRLDLFVSTMLPLETKGVRPEDHVGPVPPSTSPLLRPNCSATPLNFSIYAYEHLEGVAKRDEIPLPTELGLKSMLPMAEYMMDFGHRIATALNRNKTSWVLLNLAGIYWRIKGEASNAVECVRRALEYSPRRHRDVALVSLGNILHRSHYSHDAAVVLEAAQEISPNLNIIHFTLGNVYAHLGDYGKAEECLERAAEVESDFESTRLRLHAVRCQKVLEQTLDDQQNMLEKALEDLESYKDEFEAFNTRHDLLLNMVPTEQERNDQSQFYNDFKNQHPNLFNSPDLSLAQNHTSGSSSSLNASGDSRLSEVMVKPLAAVEEEMARLNKSKRRETVDKKESAVQRKEASHDDQKKTENDTMKAGGQTSTQATGESVDSKNNASVKTKGNHQKSHKKSQSAKQSSKKSKKKDSKKDSKKKNNKKKSTQNAGHPVVDRITDQTAPDPAPRSCGNDRTPTVCFGGGEVAPNPDGPAVRAYKKMLREQHANNVKAERREQHTNVKAEMPEQHANVKAETHKQHDNVKAKRRGPQITIDCPTCEIVEVENMDLFGLHTKSEVNSGKEESSGQQDKGQIGKETVPDNDKKQPERKDETKEKAGELSGKKQAEVPGNNRQKGNLDSLVSAKRRIRLSLVKLNETDAANSPKSIRIEVANSNGEFPEDADDPSEFDDTAIEDLPVPLLHPSRPPEDEYGEAGKLKVPPVQYRLFQNEKEMEIFKSLIKQGGKVDIVEEGFDKKEEDVDMIDGKRVIERTAERAVTEDGTVYENKYAPRLTLNPEMTYYCPKGRGLQCATPVDGEEVEHEMRIRIQQLQYNIDKVMEKPAQYGMRLGPDQHVYSLTYVNAAENRRYRLPRRRSLEEMRTVLEPNYSARPQLPTTYASQRHINESRKSARERRARSQDRVERISTDKKNPKTRQFDRDTLVPVYNQEDPPLPIPSELDDCLEYFEHTPTFDDYPSSYLGPEARGGNVSRLLTDGLTAGNMHQSPWTVPVCHDFADLPFSMNAFDHLVGVQYRENLAFLPEPQIRPLLIGMLDPDAPLEEVGQRILTAFKRTQEEYRSKDKWVLFNVAALFFRAIGNPYHAVECLRRALHYSSPHTRDVALIQLANILRRFGHVSDAAVVMRAALEQHPLEPLSHLNMATIYAAKGLRREAESHAAFALELRPDFSLAKRLHNSTICSRLFPDDEKRIHGELQEALIRRQVSEGKEPTGRPEIKCTSSDCKPTVSPITKHYGVATTTATTLAPFELPEYQYKDNPAMKPYLKRWEREEIRAGNRTKTPPVADENSVVIDSKSLLVFRYDVEQASGPDITDQAPKQYSSNLMVSAYPPFINPTTLRSTDRPINIIYWAACDYAPIPLNEDGTWKDERAEARGRPQHPHTGKVRDHLIWPSLTECGNSNLVNVWTLISTWVSPEMKGIYLRDHLDFDELFDTSRAWELPICSVEFPNNPFTLDHMPAMQYRQIFHTFNYSAEIGLTEILKSISGSRSVEMNEIAVRISLALAKNSTSWVVLNLAALYWRVNGNATRAVQCLRAALYYSPRLYKDIALSGLASVFVRTGFFDDAITVLQLANEIAPEVILNHFSMGNALAIVGYYEDAILYYESTLLHQRDFPPAKSRLKTVRCVFMKQYLSRLDDELVSGSIGLVRFKSLYRPEDVPLVDPDVVDWVMNDKPLPVEKKPICLFSKEKRYC